VPTAEWIPACAGMTITNIIYSPVISAQAGMTAFASKFLYCVETTFDAVEEGGANVEAGLFVNFADAGGAGDINFG